jgi:ferredoxin-type protein NapH
MNIRRSRTLVQTGSMILIIAIPLLNKNGIDFISGSFYSLAIGPIWISDPLIALQAVLIPLNADYVLLASMIIPLILALLLGRVFCSWVCPQNTLSELVDRAAQSMGKKRLFRQSRNPLARFIVLAFVIIMTPIAGIPLASLLSAPGIISVQIAKLVYEGIVGLEIGLIVLILAAEFFAARRGWCMHVCPIGVFLGLFRTSKTLSVAFIEDGEHVCTKCKECASTCQFGLDPSRETLSFPCHNCGDCIAACAVQHGNKKTLAFSFTKQKKELDYP